MNQDYQGPVINAESEQRVQWASVGPEVSVADAMKRLDDAGTGALVICDETRKLLGLLTDGDIRRGILQGKALSEPCLNFASQHPFSLVMPITASEALHLMNERDINQVPLLDPQGRVLALVLRKDLVPEESLNLGAVVMAGGMGTRLRPLTEKVPKPMLPVGDKPLLELTLAQLRRAGIRDVNVSVHYLSEAITDHFGNGESFGVHLKYLREDQPMGTAGGLALLEKVDHTLLVINGDVLTGAPIKTMLDYHRRQRAELTVGVRKYELQVPFGVVECDGASVTGLKEKPSMSFFINAGTYLVEPSALDVIPVGEKCDMTDVIQRLISAGRKVASFPIVEYWLDIGRHEDYQKAQEDVLSGRLV